MVNIETLKQFSKDTVEGSMIIRDDNEIISYIVDNHGKEMLRSFDERPENTGVAIFFHDKSHCKDLVIIIRTKFFDDEENNGLIMVVSTSIYNHEKRKDELIQLMTKALNDNNILLREVINIIEGHVLKSIQMNA